jgi:phosphohistidine phosphatase
MDLYLIRHADAKPLGEDGIQDDADRPLTVKGEAQSKALAKALQKHGVQLGVVVSSQLLRAKQTADKLVDHWTGPAPTLSICEEVAPGGKRRKLSKFLREQSADAIAVVGHMPGIAAYAAWLIGDNKAELELEKAGVAHIAFDEGPRKGEGKLTWLVTPEWFE